MGFQYEKVTCCCWLPKRFRRWSAWIRRRGSHRRQDTHEKDYLQTTEGKNLPIEHCIKGTDGWKLTGRIEEYAKKYPKFEKHTFGSLDLGNYIRGLANSIDEVYLVGLVSNICVISNAIIAKSALDKNGKVFVIKDAVGSPDGEMQQKAFDVLENLHIKVI